MVTSDDFVHCSSKAYNPTIYYLNLKALLVVGHKVVEQEAREGVGYRLDRVAALGASRIETFIRNLSCVNKEKLYFLPRIFEVLPSLPSQHRAANGRSDHGLSKGEYCIKSNCIENFEDLLQRYEGEGRVGVD